MIEIKSNVGPMFIVLATLAAMLLLSRLLKMWELWYNSDRKLPLSQSCKTLMIATVYVLVITSAWSFLQANTTTMSHYKNPHEVAEKKRVNESVAPNATSMVAKQKEKAEAEDSSHQEAITSFDQSMAQEEQKIRERSQTP